MQDQPGDGDKAGMHMPLASGALLSHDRIIEKIGAGGMGEVYRAQDTRLGRDVAIKVLASRLAATPEVRARFEREARTISQLNHPHICTLHDVGRYEGMDYLVMELLEGETLAHRLEKGPLPVTEVLSLGSQIAEALDVAHRRGIIHRDLKPGNVMLTKAGVKLMDFGLARPSTIAPAGGAEPDSPTMSRPLTEKGTIVGTFQYMAPEQLEGREADARSDIWALGCVLYEMATGKFAFEGTSSASLISAIMKDEPRPITELQPLSPPGLDRLVRQCLAKDPDARWQSSRDVMHELKWIGEAGSQADARAVSAPHRRGGIVPWAIAGAVVAAAVLVAVFLGDRLIGGRHEPPAFTRLTFQRGWVGSARFAPDGKSIYYCAAWDGHPHEIYETRTDLSITRSLGLHETWLHAVSRTGELAVGRSAAYYWGYNGGPLAVVPVSGTAPRDVMANASQADWSCDARTLAIVRRVGGEDRLEMPPGRVLVATSGWLSDIRISPDGRRTGFAEHSVMNDTRGNVAVVDMAGHKTNLTGEFADVQGLAWSRDGREIWFSASAAGTRHVLRAVTLDGRLRTVAQFPANVILKDIAPDGRVLLVSSRAQTGIRGKSLPDEGERELGWLDWPWPKALSADGKALLLDDQGETAGHTYTVYLRNMDGSAPVRLGQGAGCALSPDGRWALTINYGPPHSLVQIPTGPGDTLSLPRGRIEAYQYARYLPGGHSIVFVGAEAGSPQRVWLQELPAGLPNPVTPEGTTGCTPSPDGRWVASIAPDSTIALYPLQGGEPRFVTKLAAQEALNVREGGSQWSADGRTLFVGRGGVRLDVFGIDVQSGERELWKTFEVPDPAGVMMFSCVITPDGRSYAYGYVRALDELYLVEGLK